MHVFKKTYIFLFVLKDISLCTVTESVDFYFVIIASDNEMSNVFIWLLLFFENCRGPEFLNEDQGISVLYWNSINFFVKKKCREDMIFWMKSQKTLDFGLLWCRRCNSVNTTLVCTSATKCTCFCSEKDFFKYDFA